MRKMIIVDKKFQFKTTFTIVGIILILLGLVIIFIGIHTSSNNQILAGTTDKLEDNIVDQGHIIDALYGYSELTEKNDRRIAGKVIANNLRENISLMKSNISRINNIIKNNGLILLILIIFIAVQSIIVFLIFIKKTHSISGPIYVMTKYIRDLLDGGESQIRPLRRRDEFKELFELLKELINRYEKKK